MGWGWGRRRRDHDRYERHERWNDNSFSRNLRRCLEADYHPDRRNVMNLLGLAEKEECIYCKKTFWKLGSR